MILIATKNNVKFEKISSFLKKYGLDYISLEDLNVLVEVEENCATIKENAIKKVKTYFEVTGLPCIASDSGIFINNVPLSLQLGIYSGRLVQYNEDGSIKDIKKLSSSENHERIGALIKRLGGSANGKLLETYAYIDESGNIQTVDISIPRKFVFPGSKIVRPNIEARSYVFNEYFDSYLSELTDEQIAFIDREHFDIIDDFFSNIKHNTNKKFKLTNL